MGEVVLYIAASLDGYIARTDGDVSWLDAYQGEDQQADYEAFYETVRALVMGSRTYEQILSFGDWPYAERRTYVLGQRRLPVPSGADVTFYAGGPEDLMRMVRTFTQSDVWLVGGARVVGSFLKAGLVNSLRLAVVPVVLGEGIALFERSLGGLSLELEEEHRFESGIVELSYSVS